MRVDDGIFRPLAAAGLVIVVCAAGFTAWCLQAPVASAVLAEGRIAVEGQSKTVQHLDGGIVARLLVANGDTVAAGQPLLELDVADARAELAALSSEADDLGAQAARLAAELDDLPGPDFSRLASRDPAILAAAVAGQSALFDARSGERRAEAAMLDATLERMAARRTAIAAELTGMEAQAALLAEDAEASRTLVERGVTSRAAARDIERALAGLRGTGASLAAQLAEAEAAIAEARREQAGTETRRISGLSEDMARVVGRLAAIRPAIAALDERVARAWLAAPVSGTVVDLAVATIGGVVAPGEPLMRIVPDEAVLFVEARVRPADRERLISGMASEVRLPGVEARGEASLQGRIGSISADRVVSRTGSAGTSDEEHYLMTITLDAPRDAVALSPGMPVTVVVPTSVRSVVDYVLSPLRDAIARSMREV